MFTGSKFRRLFKRNHFVFSSVLFVLLILAFSVVLKPAASGETGGGFAFEKRADSLFAKPGDRVNFTLSYVNNLGETAYNVTVYDWLPSELAFAGSHPFYDGASDREMGFFRWSRGRVTPGGNGTIVVSALVNEVPMGTEITNTAHLAYELGNGTRIEIASNATVTVTQAAGVEVFPDQIHSVAPKSDARTQYNITLKNTGNALDTFEVALRSLAYSPSGSTHAWEINLFNSTGYFANSPVAIVYDFNSNNLTSWMDHGVVTASTLEMGESTWFMLRVIEAEGTSGSGDAFLDVQFTATSLFDPSVSSFVDANTIVRSAAGITFAPDYLKDASPGDTVTFNHIIVNSGQSDVVDLSYVSSLGWNYAFFNVNGVPLADSDGSGYVDVGVVPKNQYVYVLVRVTVPYSTPAGTADSVVITARGVASGSSDAVNDITTVRSAPILAVSKRLVSENPAYEGDIIVYEIHIVNLGNTRLIRIPLDDTFETTCLNFSSAQPVEDSYDEIAGNIHWENLGALEPGQNITVTVNFVATAGGEAVRENSNVIDAEDEFGNLISATTMNTDLNLVDAYTLTVTASPVEAVGGTFNATWTVHGSVNAAAFTTPTEIRCDEDTTVTVSYPESPINNGNVRYVFVDYSPSAVFLMDSDKLVTLSYRTEYVLGFDQAGSSEPVYISVDGVQLSSALPTSFWIEKGSVVTFSYPSIVIDSAGTTRYVLTGISGNETDNSVTVNAPTVVTGFYKTQYYLSVETDPEGLDNPQFSGWYDAGAFAQLEVETLTGGDGTSTRFRFDHWSGVGINDTSDASTQILMDAPKTAIAYFVKQYFVTVVSLHGSPTLSQWVDEGASLTASVTSPAETVLDQTQWRSTGYSLDGQVQLGTTCSLEDIRAPHTIEFNWVQQFWLQVDTSLVEASVSGTGWYDVGATASVSAVTPYQPSSSHRFVFVQWVSTGTEQAPIAEPRFSDTTVVMDSYYTVQANWQEQWYITVISPHDMPTSSQWVNAMGSLQVSVTSPADNDGAGTRYRCVGYSIDGGALVEGSNHAFVGVEAAHTIEFQWITQHYLTVTVSPSDVPQAISGEGWYDEGTIVDLVTPSLVAVSDGVRYRFDQWVIGTAAFPTNLVSISVDAPTTATAQFVKQFRLIVISDHDAPNPSVGEHWYDVGSPVAASVTSPTDEFNGVRYRCTGYMGSGDVPISGSAAAVDFVMSQPSTITWNWATQHKLSVTSDHDSPNPAIGEHWYDAGTSISVSVTSPADEDFLGTRYRCTGWSGTGSVASSGTDASFVFTITSPSTVVWNWIAQYKLTVSSSNGMPDPVVGEHWYDSGTQVAASVISPADENGGVRFRCIGFDGTGSIPSSGSATSVSFSITEPSSITWTWITQYKLSVASDHDSPTPTVGDHWYDAGTVISAFVTSPADDDLAGTRYRCTGWLGTGSVPSFGTSASSDFTITAPSSIDWNWIAQYRLVVVSDHDVPEPAVGEHWYDVGTSVMASVVSPADEGFGIRYRSLGWFGTGSVSDTGYSVSTSFAMMAPSSIEWVWMRQYYLTVSTDPAGLDTPTGEGWYDEGTYASISVETPTGGDMVTVRYRFDVWLGSGVVQAGEASTTIVVDSAKSVQAVFVKQFYLTLSTNFGEVTPENGWYDVGSIVSVEAFAPEVVQGKGYVWHGWIGTGEGSYRGINNPAEVTINGAITQTAAWKIDPIVTVVISNETIANGDRIVVYGETSPAQSGVAILVVYNSPSGSVIEHKVFTDDEGKFADTLVLDDGYFYPLFVDDGEWSVSAVRTSDVAHEAGQASTALSVKSQSVFQFPPIVLAGLVMALGVVAFVPPVRKKRNGNGWRRVAVLLSIASLVLGVVSLALNWVVVAGSVTNNGVVTSVGVQLYPFSQGAVSISDGISYVGPSISSLVQMNSAPVLALYLIPVGSGLALIGLYKPKNTHQRNLKTVVLLTAGVFFAASVINTYIFVQGHVSAITGAGVGFGAGVYLAIVSCALTLVSALFFTRENNGHEHDQVHEDQIQVKIEERPFFAELYPLKSEECVRFRQTITSPKTETTETDECNSHDANCPSCASWHIYYNKIVANARWLKDGI